MKQLLLVLSIFGLTFAFGQYEIGQTTLTINDPDRDRDIETYVYYPADAAGTDLDLSDGNFPIISVGHGFVMTYDYHIYLWEHLVPLGYIVALPNTETGVTVSHGDYGLDLGYVIQALQAEDENESSIFYNHIGATSAVIGHSMGGGASVLAASEYSEITTLITLAAAETDPSAISAASSVTIPSLTFAGDVDCITPPADHQEPIYDNLSDCKGYVLINDGTHCQFANSNPLCEFGEFSCPSSGLSESDQHGAVLEVITPWLEAYLKFSYDAWLTVEALEGDQSNYNLSLDCTNAPSVSLDETSTDVLSIYPNPNQGLIVLSLPIERGTYNIYRMDGSIIDQGNITGQELDLNHINDGFYLITIQVNETMIINQRILKQ